MAMVERARSCGRSHRTLRATVAALVLLAAAGGGVRLAWAVGGAERPIPPELLTDERNTIEVFRRVSPAVVFVRNNRLARDVFSLDVTEVPRGSGSGFIWDREGHVVTNLHVISGGDSFSVTVADGTTYRARVAGIAPRKDLAVLRIDAAPAELVPIELGDSSRLVVGQKVLAIGNPFGLDRTLTTGVISALGREISGPRGDPIEDVIQTDASINPGNSGGPLLDSAGRLIGVNTAIYSPTGTNAGIGFAVPADAVKRVVPQLIRYGKIRRAGLGVALLPDYLAERWGERGVIVRSVMPDGPAARAGLLSLRVDRRGAVRDFDVIVGIDDRDIANLADLSAALDRHQPGDEVVVRYRRGGQLARVTLRLGEVE
jgi:protease Do-like 1, chloroplastic